MTKHLSVILFILVVFGCTKRDIRFDNNPFVPNLGITKNHISNLGFEIKTIDCGFCSYSKVIDNIEVTFLMDFDDQCQKIVHEQYLIPLDTLKDFDEDIYRIEGYDLDYTDDSLQVQSIIKKYGVSKISNSEPLGHSKSLKFHVFNFQTQNTLRCDIVIWPNAVKYLSIEMSHRK